MNLSKTIALLTLAGWAGVSLCYLFRPDVLAALTIFPPWVWLGPYLIGALAFAKAFGRRRGLASFGVFYLTTILLCDEVPGLLRSASQANGDLTLISYNWGGAPGAEQLLISLKPDVLLLQESPKESVVAKLAEGLNANYLYKPEASIICRGELVEVETSGADNVFCTRATANIGGRSISLVSLRLRPPLMRLDLWSTSCWRAYCERRQERRTQLAAALSGLQSPAIVGGDFNCPAGDGVFDQMSPTYTDSFGAAGQGFGNTAPSFAPVHRVDQIWTTAELKPVSVVTQDAPSDHKLVLAVLDWRSGH